MADSESSVVSFASRKRNALDSDLLTERVGKEETQRADHLESREILSSPPSTSEPKILPAATLSATLGNWAVRKGRPHEKKKSRAISKPFIDEWTLDEVKA